MTDSSLVQGDVDKIAGIYANALVDLAQSKNVLDTVHADVDSLQVSRSLHWQQAESLSFSSTNLM